ncbi:hypothetical protein [Microbacterium sp. CPCC 204701]|uniref:hypothetical protein n=1 Tax=Microbacterium sp. CPCC 204701 TaxID=2493084 RepID=UPI0013E3099A|nr:hypothetical protein [Microbacterium sp. CPCC 204701]
MARIGGRNSWIAVPAGLLCAAVVAGLAYLALPMVPVTVTWIGDTLRRATTPQPAPAPEESIARQAADGAQVDCRGLYPDDLWNELTWRAGSRLDQSAAPPVTQAAAFTDAVTPDVVVTCEWRSADGGIVTTLSRVDADAGAFAEAALGGQGFSCASTDTGLVCTRTDGGVLEEHTLRDGLWIASAQTRWHPDEYGARLGRNVFG